MSMPDAKRANLQAVEAEIARLTQHLRRLEGLRDQLRAESLDNTGAHDRRPVAVR